MIASIAMNGLRYNLALFSRNRRFGRRKPRGRFHTPGKVIAVDKLPHGAQLHTERVHVDITFLSPHIIRVRMRQDGVFNPPFSYAIDKIDWPPPKVAHRDTLEAFTAGTNHLVCRVTKDTCRLVIETNKGHVISEDNPGLAWRGPQVRWTRRLPEHEGCYGLGERAASLDLRGRRWALWNADPMPYARGADPLYTSIPFYLGVRPKMAYGILWDNPARGYVDLGAANPKEMTFAADDGELRYYLIAGKNAEDVLAHYTELTGHMPLPPLWALGFQQSRWSYLSEAEFRTLAHEFRQRQIPCDVLYFDIDYMDGFRCFTWDHQRFPRLSELVTDLSEQGFKSVAIIDPGIKVDPGYQVYEGGAQQDVFLKYPDGQRVIGPVWPGRCHFPDFTSARVRAWWGEQFPALSQTGFAGVWNDMNEPALITGFGSQTLADYVEHDYDGIGQTHVQGGHNVYGMQMVRATREALQKLRPDERHFVMTRAAYAGTQRYATTWTGDNLATWDHLRLSISTVLNQSLSGMAFTGPDIGGFSGEPDGELFARWMQLGSMLPYFRVHSMKGTAPQEPWRYGERVETISRQAIELRYQLLPYFYTQTAENARRGTPIVRPLFMLEPDDPTLRGLDDAFLVGDALLVAPVLEPGATQRQVYLPHGEWYEFDTGKRLTGGQTITVDAPLERLPLFVRAGKVIPMWPVMQYVGEKPVDELHLRVYAGAGETTLYEDAGSGLAYQHGDYRWSYFTCQYTPSGQFAINWRRAGTYAPPYSTVRVEITGCEGEPESVDLDQQGAPIWYYEGGIVELVVKPFETALIKGPQVDDVDDEPPPPTLLRPPSR